MSKDPKNEIRGEVGAGLTLEELRQQQDAMREEVLRMVGKRLDDRLGAVRPKPGAETGGWFARHRPEIYLFFTAVAMMWLYTALSDRPRTGGDEPLPDDPVVVESDGTASLMADVVARPDAELQSYMEGNPTRASNWLKEAARANGLAAGVITPELTKQLDDLAAAPRAVPEAQLPLLRNLFFVYAYGRWERQERKGSNAIGFRVDTAYTGFDTTLVRSLVNRLDLSHVVKGPIAVTDPGVRTAVVLRWFQSYPAPNNDF